MDVVIVVDVEDPVKDHPTAKTREGGESYHGHCLADVQDRCYIMMRSRISSRSKGLSSLKWGVHLENMEGCLSVHLLKKG